MKKTLAILLAVVMAITLFTACGDKPAPTPDTKTGSVYYLNFKPEADKAWQDLAKLYTERKRKSTEQKQEALRRPQPSRT